MSTDEEWWKELSCPFTWSDGNMPCISIPKFTVHDTVQRLDFKPTPWHRVVEMMNVAYSHATHKRQCDAVALLRECYVYMLPQPHCQHDCALIRDYRAALRHVLDSFWACMEFNRANKLTPTLRDFVAGITPFWSLDRHSKSAVHAMRAHMNTMMPGAGHPHLQKSLELNPQEGEWHSMTGTDWLSGPPPDQLEFHLRQAHSLRPGPHTGLDLAERLAHSAATRPEALQLVRDTLRAYPNHPHVLYNAGRPLVTASGNTKESMAEAEQLLLSCMRLLGERSLIRHSLSTLCSQQEGRAADARRHREMAENLECLEGKPRERLVSMDEFFASMGKN